MTEKSWRFVQAHIRTVAALLALFLHPVRNPLRPREQVQSSTPSVTYNYHNDQELLQVDHRATTYCTQYRSLPQALNFKPDPNGGNYVVFQCVPATTIETSQEPVNPNLTYTYENDAELLTA